MHQAVENGIRQRRVAGLHHSVIPRALRVPYPKVDRVIAKGLGVAPSCEGGILVG